MARDNDRGIIATSSRINAQYNRSSFILVLRARRRFVHQAWRDELVVSIGGELSIHFDSGLRGVRAVLFDDLLVDRFVGVFDLPGVDALRRPEVPFRVEALIEIALIPSWVAKRKPETVWRVLSKEACGHRPDRVRDTRGFVEDDHDAIMIVYPGIRVRVFF